MKTKLFIVVPVYNEEAVLRASAAELERVVLSLSEKEKISKESVIVFVNDGSTDSSLEIIKELSEKEHFRGISLSCNKGHQNALLAGLEYAFGKCDAVITIDADLQDDTAVIEEMIDKLQSGKDIVYGVRNDRSADSFFKRTSAEMFYKLMQHFGAKTINNHADFRLLSARALGELLKYKERNIYLRGMVPLIGLPSDNVYYKRKERSAGESKYPFGKMFSFAAEGITSFSIKPLRLITWMGLLVFLASIAMMIYVVIRFLSGATVAGWASIVVSVWAIGGLLLLAVGIVGEYVGKIYIEVKNRPLYVIEEIYGE